MLIIYLFGWSSYISDSRIIFVDLTSTIIMSFVFLFGTYKFSNRAGLIEEITKLVFF